MRDLMPKSETDFLSEWPPIRVVRLLYVDDEGVIRLIDHLLESYIVYAASDGDGESLFDEVFNKNLSVLKNTPKQTTVTLYSNEAYIRRPEFRFGAHHMLIEFSALDFNSDSFSFEGLTRVLDEWASIIGVSEYEVYYEINDEWRAGEFSDRTLILKRNIKAGR